MGVGQSETTVAGMTDMFVVMQLPNAGDDLQAIKKGIMEIADVVLINKSDLDENAASQAQAFIESAFHLLAGHAQTMAVANKWQPQALRLSALSGNGVSEFWSVVSDFKQRQMASGEWQNRRQSQSLKWLQELIQTGLKMAFIQNPKVASYLPSLEQDVLHGRIAASTAARQLLAL
jgi:LAO/AO transport system kinase